MLDSEQISESKAIQRRTGRTFHLATRLLPERVRHATYVLYAFFRVADDVVDDPADRPADEMRAELGRIRAAVLDGEPTDDPVLSAFQRLRDRYDIPDEDVATFMDAMERDVTESTCETYADLEAYMRGSSVAVANMMMAVMEVEDVETARPHAKALAEAFQLTNFVRDVREDIRDYDRVYLPQETLDRHGVTEADLRADEATDGVRAAVRDELRRAERRYHVGVAGIEHLPEDCRFAVLVASVLYAEHHRLIRAREFDVLADPPELGLARSALLVARTWVRWRLHADAEAAFYAVSPVSNPGGRGESRDDDGRVVGDAA